MKKGFTLAEVLVTLMVIGIVAVLTIPSILENIQKTQLVSAYKRMFSETFSAVTEMVVKEDCGKRFLCTGQFQTDDPLEFGNSLTSVLSTVVNCKKNDMDCFTQFVNPNYDGSGTSDSIVNQVAALNDGEAATYYYFKNVRGASYLIHSFGTDCETNLSTDNTIDNPMRGVCGYMVIDVNGEKSPNAWGRDVFGMWITDYKVLELYPFGGQYDNKIPKTTCRAADTNGMGCAGRILEDGWTMQY
ncbi:MAG: type II secretion system protein [Candidatus Gastranaerophilales bacterium]|nr:type II secretion system protein [Candidatus Gastranaerophilales bacterium]